MKTWHFGDWWHVENQDNVILTQGCPRWIPEGPYEDPTLDYMSCWPAISQGSGRREDGAPIDPNLFDF